MRNRKPRISSEPNRTGWSKRAFSRIGLVALLLMLAIGWTRRGGGEAQARPPLVSEEIHHLVVHLPGSDAPLRLRMPPTLTAPEIGVTDLFLMPRVFIAGIKSTIEGSDQDLKVQIEKEGYGLCLVSVGIRRFFRTHFYSTKARLPDPESPGDSMDVVFGRSSVAWRYETNDLEIDGVVIESINVTAIKHKNRWSVAYLYLGLPDHRTRCLLINTLDGTIQKDETLPRAIQMADGSWSIKM